MRKRIPIVLAIFLVNGAVAHGLSKAEDAPKTERKTDPESSGTPVLVFRIAADAKHDQAAIEKAKSPDGLRNPPSGYRWAGIDERSLDLHEGDIIREEAESGGKRRKYLLVKLDPYNVTEADLARVEKAKDERQQPAITVYFKPDGARRFGELTRTHLPEDTGGRYPFKYKLAIIIDGVVASAPMINSVVREAAIIEFGGRLPSEEVDHLINRIADAKGNKGVEKGSP